MQVTLFDFSWAIGALSGSSTIGQELEIERIEFKAIFLVQARPQNQESTEEYRGMLDTPSLLGAISPDCIKGKGRS